MRLRTACLAAHDDVGHAKLPPFLVAKSEHTLPCPAIPSPQHRHRWQAALGAYCWGTPSAAVPATSTAHWVRRGSVAAAVFCLGMGRNHAVFAPRRNSDSASSGSVLPLSPISCLQSQRLPKLLPELPDHGSDAQTCSVGHTRCSHTAQ